MEHEVIPPGEIHAPHNWVVADEAARLALVVTAADLGKYCWQRAGEGEWFLIGHMPAVWKQHIGPTGADGAPGADGDAADIAGETHAATAKTTPVDADELGITDSATSWGFKKLTFANLKAWISSLGGAGISNTPSGNISATNVQAAINELDSEKASKTGDTISGNLNVTGNALVTGGGALGYGVGAGGTASQPGQNGGSQAKNLAVTLNKSCGQITTGNASMAQGAVVAFKLTNFTIANSDLLIATLRDDFSPANYAIRCSVGTGEGLISLTNVSGGRLAEAVVLNFMLIKGATS